MSRRGIMGPSGELLLQSTFPSLEVTVVSDVFSQCNSNVEAAAEHLRALFPEAYAAKDQGQSQSQDLVPEAWTSPTQSPVQSPKKLFKTMNSPGGPSQKLNSDFLQLMFPKSPGGPKKNLSEEENMNAKNSPKSPGRPKKDLSEASTNLNGPSSKAATKPEKLNCVEVDLPENANRLLYAIEQNESQVGNRVHASLPFLHHLLPLEKSSDKASKSAKSTSGDSRDLSLAAPTGFIDPHGSSMSWDSLLTNPESSAASGASAQTAASAVYGNNGGLKPTGGSKGMLPEPFLLMQSCTSSTRSSSPERRPSALAAPHSSPGAREPEDEDSRLHLLVEMFPTLEPALVSDVLDGVQGDSDTALQQLLDVQDVADRKISCFASEDGSASADGASSRGGFASVNVASPNGGQVWDTSGVPVDYTFKDLTPEQKVAYVRKQLPPCTAEEAHNALEACELDVSAAIASLLQVYDEGGRRTAATSAISLSREALVLQKSFPTADPEALMNALAACNNNIESAKATLRDNGINQIAQPVRILPRPTESPPSPAKKPAASSLFSPPQAAEITQAPDMQWGHCNSQRPVRGIVRRRDAANQHVYDECRSKAYEFKKTQIEKIEEANRAFQRGKYDLAKQLNREAQQARVNYEAAQNEARSKIFTKNNAKRKQVMTHDLHGLHVHEAKETVGGILQGLCSMPPEAFTGVVVDCITGKGLHSSDGTCKLREELFSWAREEGFDADLRMPHNDGVVICLTAENAGWRLEDFS